MSFRIVIGSAGAGKTYYMCSEMLQEIKKDNNKNFIYIVPEQFTLETQRKMVNMQRELFSLSGIMNVDIVSFNRLSFRVFEELGVDTLSILDDTGKTLILRKIIEENKDKLCVYKNKSSMLGFIDEMKSAISELYQYGIDIDNLDEIINKINSKTMVKAKLLDIRLIYEKFREYVSDMTSSTTKYITKEEVLNELCQYIDNSGWIKNSHIVLDGYTGFTPIQLKVIEKLMLNGGSVTIAVTMRTEEINITSVGFADIKEQELFAMSKDTINKLYAIANDNRVIIEKPVIIPKTNGRHRENKELSFLEENVFQYNNKTYEGKSQNVKIYRAATSIAEAKNVTNLIQKLLRDNEGLRYRDIAVITGDDELAMNLSRFLRAEKIPHFVDNKKSIIRNPFVDAIRTVLEVIDTDFKYESVFKYLRCYMSDVCVEDIDVLENYCLALGIRGYKNYSKPFTKTYKGVIENEAEEAERIRGLFVEPIFNLKEKLKDKTVKGVTTALYEFIVEAGLKEKLYEYIEFFEQTGNNELLTEYKQVYKKVMELFDKLVLLLGDEKISLTEYRKILDAGFEEIKVGIIPFAIDQIIIGDIERTRLGEIKYLFIMGANDGIIPKHSIKGGLLSQNDRIRLKNMSVLLSPTVRENSFIQRFYLYMSLTKPSDKIYITYSEIGSNGEVLRPSYLIETVKELFSSSKIETVINNKVLFEIANKSTIYELLISNLQKYGTEAFDKDLMEILAFAVKDEELREKLKDGIAGAMFKNDATNIDKAVALEIYGGDRVFKATRLEKYAACAYAHFLEYGLKLVERPVYEIKHTDIGSLYHALIEAFMRKIKNNNIDVAEIDDKKRRAIINECMEELSKKSENAIFFDNKRNQFILKKCIKVADKTTWALIGHLQKGSFKISQIEFATDNGRIDRVDTLNIDGTEFVKVIDYKSGSEKFSPVKVVNGLKMQLMFYMDAVIKNEKNLHKDLRVEPAAVFYFNIDDPILNYKDVYEDESKYEKDMFNHFEMTGFVNSREEVFEGLDSDIRDSKVKSPIFGMKNNVIGTQMYLSKTKGAASCYNFEGFIDIVKNLAEEFASEIVEGSVKLKPYKIDKKTACDYCKYKQVCCFSCKDFDNSYNIIDTDNKENISILEKKLNKEIVLEGDNQAEAKEDIEILSNELNEKIKLDNNNIKDKNATDKNIEDKNIEEER